MTHPAPEPADTLPSPGRADRADRADRAGRAVRADRADRAVWALTATFAANGVTMGSFVARVPALRDQTGATKGQLGVALLAIGVGSILAMPATARLVRRFGTSWVVAAAATVTISVWALAAASTSVWVLAALLLVTGTGIGTWDVAMNVAGHDAEQRDNRSWMPRLHAAFSGGAVAGAGVAAVAVQLGASPAAQLAAVGVVLLGLVLACVRVFPPHGVVGEDHRDHPRHTGSLWRTPVVLIGLVTVGTAFGEGAANDWLALTLVDVRGASQTVAAIAYGTFNVAMLAGRLAGGPVIERWGRTPVVRTSMLVAAAGILVLCFVPAVWAGLVAALLWGLGLAVVFPATMSAAGEAVPGRGAEGIAVASTTGYAGFLAGPPLLGFLADHVGLDRSLVVVAGLVTLGACLAGLLREGRRFVG